MGGERRADRPGYVALGSLLTGIETGKSPLAENTPAGDGEWGVLKVSAIQAGRFVPHENKVIRSADLIHKRFEVRSGDLIMTRANTEDLVGFACVAEEPPPRLLLSDKTLRLCVDKTVADPKFVELALGRPNVRQRIRATATGTSAGMKNMSQEQVRQLTIPDLLLDEQRGIVAAHAAFERRIAGLERVRAKRVRLLQGLVDHLLSGLPEKRTSLGEASRSIDAGITLGSHRVPRKHTAGYLRVANVRKGWIDSADITRLEALERDRKRYGLQSGDVLVVEGHADPDQIARSAVVGAELEGLLYQNHLFRIRFEGVLPEFAMLWLNSESVRGYWRERCATSSGLYTINSRMLEQVPFPEAGLDQQQRVVSAWAAANVSINTLGKQVGKLRTVQQAVVEDFLGGRALDSAA
nr:hypothetical protein OG999_16490 [Streptomyces sp. NBC_00886]